MTFFRASFAIFAFLVSALSAHAQFGVYLLGSGGHLSGTNVGYNVPTGSTGGFTAWGGTLGLYDDFIKAGPVRVGTDIRGFIQHSGNGNSGGPGTQFGDPANSNQLRAALGGLRLAVAAPAIPVRPYIQAEIGAGSTNFGKNLSRTGEFAYQVQVGGDFTVVPHVDVRAEYGIGELIGVFGGDAQSMQQFGAGVVLRF